MRKFYVYIVASHSKVIYTGFTGDLRERIQQHRGGLFPGFTQQYQCKRLVYYEEYSTVATAIAREKQIKRWRREKKVVLIEEMNPLWLDLFEALPYNL